MKFVRVVTDRLRHRDCRVLGGPARGLYFNPSGSNVAFVLGHYEPGLQKAFTLLLAPGMTFYDLGGNVGFFSVLASRLVGPGGRVHAFEPLPSNASAIRHNLELNGFSRSTVHEMAISDSNGEATFNVADMCTVGRLASVGDAADQVDTIRVQVAQLDSLRETKQLEAPDVIKIDVEGAEAGVIRGAKQILAESSPVLLIELHGTNREVHEALSEVGYRSRILGTKAGILEAPEDSYVVAVPQQREALFRRTEPLTHESVLGR